jgi:hypothetical protein
MLIIHFEVKYLMEGREHRCERGLGILGAEFLCAVGVEDILVAGVAGTQPMDGEEGGTFGSMRGRESNRCLPSCFLKEGIEDRLW